MIRTLVMFVALAAAGVFAYFYFSDASGRAAGDKFADAAKHTLETGMDQGLQASVKVSVSASVGVSMARFLHVWSSNGKVLIYGLYPDGLNVELLRAAAMKVPGVKEVDVRVAPRPTYLDGPATPVAPSSTTPQPGPG